MSTTEGRPHRRFRVNMRELMALVFLISVPLGLLVGQAHTLIGDDDECDSGQLP